MTLSVAVVVVFDRFVSNSEVPLSAFAIFWSLALLYAIGSRFFVRYLFAATLNGKSAARVAIYGAGDAGRAPVVRAARRPGLRAGRLHR